MKTHLNFAGSLTIWVANFDLAVSVETQRKEHFVPELTKILFGLHLKLFPFDAATIRTAMSRI